MALMCRLSTGSSVVPTPPGGSPAARSLRLPQEAELVPQEPRLVVTQGPSPASSALLEDFKANRGQMRLELKVINGPEGRPDLYYTCSNKPESHFNMECMT